MLDNLKPDDDIEKLRQNIQTLSCFFDPQF